jgi:transposase
VDSSVAKIGNADVATVVVAVGDALTDALVRPGYVVVHLIFSQDCAQVCLAEDQHAIEEFPAQGADQALADRVHPRSLDGRAHDPGASAGQRVALSQLARITALPAEITQLEKDLAALVTALVPELMATPGIAVITAAKILGEAGDIRRFRSPAAFARHNGTAPVPASSGTHTGHDGPYRLNRGGNRQLNAALHRIAVVQPRCHPGATALLERRGQDKHKIRKASLRALKHHLSDVIYRALNADAWRLGQPAPRAA